ncbi:nicotinamide-nucleotide adenylyltransferase [Salinarchaeum laminariae]|uniref:nicotinamide-nucleotide adenylyltransferase n=1 Tax=Salinarchaeum laminariae TaxID=869888 RepID=UPI0020C12FA3|nr:nicotinamide-nucleotide adenylyltransferase [Salinarchaeum laminariae]
MKRGFYVGRFQPLHEGHEAVLREIATECDELVVGIGSADKSHSVDNPFTAGERHVMITRTLATLDVEAFVVPIVDVDRNALWTSHVKSLCPPFDVVYSNNPLVTRLFEEEGVEVRELPMFNRAEYEGTGIRERMLSDDPWEHLVPETTVEAIEDVDGVGRLQEVASDDAAEE